MSESQKMWVFAALIVVYALGVLVGYLVVATS